MNCASSWLIKNNSTKKHGQQNIKYDEQFTYTPIGLISYTVIARLIWYNRYHGERQNLLFAVFMSKTPF